MTTLEGAEVTESVMIRRALPSKKDAARHIFRVLVIAGTLLAALAGIRASGLYVAGQTAWWPVNGTVLALLLRVRRRRWMDVLGGVALGALVARHLERAPGLYVFAKLLANLAGPVCAAALLPRCVNLEQWLQARRLVLRFMLAALLLAPLVAAVLSTGCDALFRHGTNLLSVVERHDITEMLGYALMTPLTLVLISRESYRGLRLESVGPASVLVLGLGMLSWLVFSQSVYELTFLPALVAALMALYVGFRASVIGVNLLAVVAALAITHRHGLFVPGAVPMVEPRMLMLPALLASTMVVVFAISVIQVERESFQARLKGAYAKMEELATIDPLTGVSNRRRFEEALEAVWQRAVSSGTTVALMMIDADHFKAYNDKFGHPAGDECLRAVASAVAQRAGTAGMLARYGGEEFVLMLPGASQKRAREMAEEIRRTVEGLFERPQSPLQRTVTVSIGCSWLRPHEEIGSQVLVASADQALYRAKEKGRNRVESAEPGGLHADSLRE